VREPIVTNGVGFQKVGPVTESKHSEPREALPTEVWPLLNSILDAGPFGHHIKGDPDEGEWHCTCDEASEWMTAEQHIAEVVFRGAFPFARTIAVTSTTSLDMPDDFANLPGDREAWIGDDARDARTPGGGG
jgi:hypothetical protein